MAFSGFVTFQHGRTGNEAFRLLGDAKAVRMSFFPLFVLPTSSTSLLELNLWAY
jgi:hypothetical protein